jgi:hypothetical protein
MRTFYKATFFAFAVTNLAACNLEDQGMVTVAVYPTTKRCTIKEIEVDCAQVGEYLRDTLKIAPERQIAVSFTGMDPGSEDDKSIDRIADVVRAAGFKDVRTPRIDMKK